VTASTAFSLTLATMLGTKLAHPVPSVQLWVKSATKMFVVGQCTLDLQVHDGWMMTEFADHGVRAPVSMNVADILCMLRSWKSPPEIYVAVCMPSELLWMPCDGVNHNKAFRTLVSSLRSATNMAPPSVGSAVYLTALDTHRAPSMPSFVSAHSHMLTIRLGSGQQVCIDNCVLPHRTMPERSVIALRDMADFVANAFTFLDPDSILVTTTDIGTVDSPGNVDISPLVISPATSFAPTTSNSGVVFASLMGAPLFVGGRHAWMNVPSSWNVGTPTRVEAAIAFVCKEDREAAMEDRGLFWHVRCLRSILGATDRMLTMDKDKGATVLGINIGGEPVAFSPPLVEYRHMRRVSESIWRLQRCFHMEYYLSVTTTPDLLYRPFNVSKGRSVEYYCVGIETRPTTIEEFQKIPRVRIRGPGLVCRALLATCAHTASVLMGDEALRPPLRQLVDVPSSISAIMQTMADIYTLALPALGLHVCYDEGKLTTAALDATSDTQTWVRAAQSIEEALTEKGIPVSLALTINGEEVGSALFSPQKPSFKVVVDEGHKQVPTPTKDDGHHRHHHQRAHLGSCPLRHECCLHAPLPTFSVTAGHDHIVAHCDAGCRIYWHLSCWKNSSVQDEDGAEVLGRHYRFQKAARNMEMPCLTPGCSGTLTYLAEVHGISDTDDGANVKIRVRDRMDAVKALKSERQRIKAQAEAAKRKTATKEKKVVVVLRQVADEMRALAMAWAVGRVLNITVMPELGELRIQYHADENGRAIIGRLIDAGVAGAVARF
jgi:hypothetical protein